MDKTKPEILSTRQLFDGVTVHLHADGAISTRGWYFRGRLKVATMWRAWGDITTYTTGEIPGYLRDVAAGICYWQWGICLTKKEDLMETITLILSEDGQVLGEVDLTQGDIKAQLQVANLPACYYKLPSGQWACSEGNTSCALAVHESDVPRAILRLFGRL